MVAVFIPEYVVGHWWEHLLHNQTALRLKSRLLFTPGVMVTSVPWQLRSSVRAARRPERAQLGAARRGIADPARPGDRLAPNGVRTLPPAPGPAAEPGPAGSGREPDDAPPVGAGRDPSP